MKHIHIVEPYHSVAMQRLSEPLEKGLIGFYEITKSEVPDITADLNYHLPFHTLVGLQDKGDGKHVIVYTHCNPGVEAALVNACSRADLIICMSYTGRQELIDLGISSSKLWVIYSAADGFTMRKRNVGIVATEQPNGRKRSHILIDLALQMDLTGFHFVIVGGNWADTVDKLQNLGISVEWYPVLEDEDLKSIYAKTDLFLVTGYIEGGPLPLLEALACGVPVFSPPVGYANDFLDKDCIYNNVDELVDLFQNYIAPFGNRQRIAKIWTWANYVEEHALVLGRLLENSVDILENHGAGRYAQLLNVIDEIKPVSIVEIGTWRGDRAIQMIQQAAKYHPIQEITYQGFDLFEEQTAEDVAREFSKWSMPENTVQQRLDATMADIQLFKGLTFETLERGLKKADLYFIDGGHSEKTIAHDWCQISLYLNAFGGVTIFDDFYYGEHPVGIGCNSLIDRLEKENLWEVTMLPVITQTETLSIGMVRVQKKEN